MSRACRLLALALPLGLAIACSAPSACETAYGDPGTEVESEGHSGNARLETAESALVVAFDARLSGLPELWESHSAVRAGVVLEYSLSYEQAPFGGDGLTEMPRVGASLSASSASDAASVSAPFSSSERVGADLFDCFDQSSAYCCELGSRECEQPLWLRLERLDGAAFPPVVLSFTLRASATVSECPLDQRADPSLALVEREAP